MHLRFHVEEVFEGLWCGGSYRFGLLSITLSFSPCHLNGRSGRLGLCGGGLGCGRGRRVGTLVMNELFLLGWGHRDRLRGQDRHIRTYGECQGEREGKDTNVNVQRLKDFKLIIKKYILNYE